MTTTMTLSVTSHQLYREPIMKLGRKIVRVRLENSMFKILGVPKGKKKLPFSSSSALRPPTRKKLPLTLLLSDLRPAVVAWYLRPPTWNFLNATTAGRRSERSKVRKSFFQVGGGRQTKGEVFFFFNVGPP